MRIIATVVCVITIIAALPTYAQKNFMEWTSTPVQYTLSDKYKEESGVVLEDYRKTTLKEDSDGEIYVYVELKRRIKVLDDKGVESYNKIYVRVSNDAQVKKIMARTILPDGKIINMPEDKILDVEEEGKRYKKFAMEGVVKGSEIEYYSEIKYPLFVFGMEYFMFNSAPIQHAKFELSVPEHLFFDVKGYNGFIVEKDTLVNKNRYVYAYLDNIEPIKEEQYGYVDPHLPSVHYKLSYNYARDKNVRMNTWSNLAKNVYTNYHSFSSKEIKAMENFLKKISIPKNATTDQKISLIESYIKSNINITSEPLSDNASEIEQIVKTKVASNFGATRLIIGVLESAGLKPSIVFPSKRDDTPIDESFENFRLLNDIIFYFPETDKFLDPVNIENRYPVINPTCGATTGIFIKETEIGGFKSAIASFDTIPLLPFESSSTDMDVTIKFNKERDSLHIDSKQILSGYSSVTYRFIYNSIPKDKHEDFTKDIVSNISESDSITKMKIDNMDYSNVYDNKPLVISAHIQSADLLESAGPNMLIKIGEIIGTQAQMYDDKKRKLPIVIQYPHDLKRIIRLEIPSGYKIKNLNDLKLNIIDKDAKGSTMGFISDYTLNGNLLTININEYYKETYYPVERIDEFKSVINAAADFNKIVLVMEKL